MLTQSQFRARIGREAEKRVQDLNFELNGTADFNLLWLIRVAGGNPYPFGPIWNWAQKISCVGDDYQAPFFAAVFSSRYVPGSDRADVRRLSPALMIQTSKTIPEFTWLYRGFSDYYGGNYEIIKEGEIPRKFYKILRAALGEDYPVRLR